MFPDGATQGRCIPTVASTISWVAPDGRCFVQTNYRETLAALTDISAAAK